jgi:hypothetical protein
MANAGLGVNFRCWEAENGLAWHWLVKWSGGRSTLLAIKTDDWTGFIDGLEARNAMHIFIST